MLEQDTVIVGEDSFVIESLPATRALQLLTRVVKIAGGLGHGVTDMPSSLTEAKELGKELEKHMNLGAMLEGFLENLDVQEHPNLVKAIIKESLPVWRDRPKTGENSFDEWYENRFSRGINDQFVLLYHIFKWNYGDPAEWFSGFFAKAQVPETVSTPGRKKPSKA